MRKILFLTAIIILIVNVVSAQKAHFGFTAGPVAATMFQKVSKKKSTADYRYGVIAGVFLDIPMQKNGSFQPAINFVTKGKREDYAQGNVNGTLKTDISYLEADLSVIFRIKYKTGNVILGGGPVSSLPISGTRVFDVANAAGKEELEFGDKTTSDYNGTDFGLKGRLGYEFGKNLSITASYYYGINRQFVGGDPKDKLYHRYFALQVGYKIAKK